jgi:hypothetical protein
LRRVLILGGYGSFGARISELLAKTRRFEVIVGGRNLAKAQAHCRSRPDLDLKAAQIDRDMGLAATLAELRPWLVVDAAGPFQDATYNVARCCIQAGCHYIDIADGRTFVENFHRLDAEARAAGLTLISGASSVPALSSAVASHLAKGLDVVGLVESAITSSARATVGRSVMEAILSYVGKPVALRQAGRDVEARGWRGLRRQTFATSRRPPLAGRWVAICDVPDLALLSDRFPGRPLVIFRAGAELAIQTLGLWLLSCPVQWGWLSDLRPLAGGLHRLAGLTARLGGDRSAMQVRVVGRQGDETVERRWTLIADHGKGPYTPSLASPLLAIRLADAGLRPGAYPAVGLLELEAFEPDFTSLGFDTEITESRPKPLYRRVLGDAFERLPPAVRQMHELAGAGLAEGRATVTRGTNPLARFVARIMGFPPAGRDVPVSVRFVERDGRETWVRQFGDSTFSSELSQDDGLMIERFGALRFGFALEGGPDGLGMHLRRWWFGPIPMPLALGPKGLARETEQDGLFHFDVPIALPLLGSIVSYHGSLRRV